MNMSTFQSQGMTPEVTGEYGAYPDSSTVDRQHFAEQAPRVSRRPARQGLQALSLFAIGIPLFLLQSNYGTHPQCPYRHDSATCFADWHDHDRTHESNLTDAARQSPDRIHCLGSDLRTFQRVERW